MELSLRQIFDIQKRAYLDDTYPSLKVRLDRIDRLISMLQKEQYVICEAIESDFGKRSHENSRMFDIVPPLNSLRYARKNLPNWMSPEKRKCNFPYGLIGAKARVQYIPAGVVGNVSPWNFPITLALSPMGGILAAGNRVMIKPSELTPSTSNLLRDIVARNFDQSEIAVVVGGVDVAEEFCSLPFDHLVFTGSTSVGRLIAKSAAENLVPTTLELGGKCPVIIGSNADLDDVASKVVFAKTLNAGQICLAPDYLMIDSKRKDALIEKLKNYARQYFPNGVASKDYVNVISCRHADRLRSYLEESKQLGDRVIALLPDDSTDPRCLAPYAVEVFGSGGRLMQEEIFGPLLPILTIDDFDEMVYRVKSCPRPLALYYFGNDEQQISYLATHVAAGGMVVNDVLVHFLQDDLPFGGTGDSGIGNYHGREGFVRFSHAKSIFYQSRIDIGELMRPPYGDRFRRILNFEIRG